MPAGRAEHAENLFDDKAFPTRAVVNDVAPTLELDGPGTVDEGSVYTLSLKAFDPGTDTVISWTINWGDGDVSTVLGEPATADHVYADGSNTYNISVSATNEDGEFQARDTFRVDVQNVKASALELTLDGDMIEENSEARLTGRFADPGTEDRYLVLINWGPDEGTTEILLATGQFTFAADHAYRDDNPTATPSDRYPITVELTDNKDGLSTTGSIDLTVNNEIPQVQRLERTMINEGNPFSLPAMTFSDKGTLDTHTATIDWGDEKTDPGTITESGGSGTVTGSHEYLDNGTYIVVVCVTDDDTGEDCGSLTVAVNNVPPLVSIGNDAEFSEGDTIDIAGRSTDRGRRCSGGRWARCPTAQ